MKINNAQPMDTYGTSTFNNAAGNSMASSNSYTLAGSTNITLTSDHTPIKKII